MPQNKLEQQLIIRMPPSGPRVQLPEGPKEGPGHFFDVMVGLDEQVPGDGSDAIAAAAGMLPIFGLGKKLGKALGLKTPTPAPKTRDPFGLDPKMDRREFFRRASGKRMHDADKAIRELDDDAHLYDPGYIDPEPFMNEGLLVDDAKTAAATNRVWNKLMEKYWPIDNSYADSGRNVIDTTKRFGRALSTNFENEVRQGLTHDVKEGFEKGLDEAGKGTAKLMDTLLKRIGIRK